MENCKGLFDPSNFTPCQQENRLFDLSRKKGRECIQTDKLTAFWGHLQLWCL